MSADDKDIEALVEASSLGTPEAKAARESVSDETAARIVARSHQLEAEDLRAQIRDLLEEREELLTEIRRLQRGNHPAGQALTGAGAAPGAVVPRADGVATAAPAPHLALAEALTERDAEHTREQAWEEGRRHGEQNFISCPDDNPYRGEETP